MGKFDNKEAARTAEKSTAGAMGMKKAKQEKQLVSFKASTDMYGKFSYINDQLGITNTTALNMMISDYVKKNENLL